MTQRLIRYLTNAVKFIRAGGIANVNISIINYPEILKSKKILITGGSGGIGYAIAKKYLSVGAKVLITGRNAENLMEAKNRLNNPNLYTIVWDVSDISLIKEKIISVHQTLGGIDILINNAGFGINKEFNEITEDIWNKTIDTNLKSIFFISQHLCDYFMKNNIGKESKIINISSMQGFISEANPYNISKFGINSITCGLAKLFTRNNIIVNAIAPGYTATNMNPMNVYNNAYKSGSLNSRIALPEEIAELALFLASDASNNIIGQTIVIDGGESIL